MDNKDLLKVIDQLLAANVVQSAQIDNLLALVVLIFERLGLTALEGLSVRDWFQKEKMDQIERILIHFEDKNPSVAALLQQMLDNSRNEGTTPHANDWERVRANFRNGGVGAAPQRIAFLRRRLTANEHHGNLHC